MSIARRLASQTAIYGISSNVGRVLTYLLVPIYTALLCASGVRHCHWPVCLRGLPECGVYLRHGNHVFSGLPTGRGPNRRDLYNRSLTLLLLTTLGLTALLLALRGPVLALLDIPARPRPSTPPGWPLFLGSMRWRPLPFARLRLADKARRFATIRLVSIGLNVGLNLFFIVLCPAVLGGKLSARVCSRWWPASMTPAWAWATCF